MALVLVCMRLTDSHPYYVFSHPRAHHHPMSNPGTHVAHRRPRAEEQTIKRNECGSLRPPEGYRSLNRKLLVNDFSVSPTSKRATRVSKLRTRARKGFVQAHARVHRARIYPTENLAPDQPSTPSCCSRLQQSESKQYRP
jgi:hypothetical protein